MRHSARRVVLHREWSRKFCRSLRWYTVRRPQSATVGRPELDLAWSDARQRARALDSLVADGLAEPLAGDRYRLPVG